MSEEAKITEIVEESVDVHDHDHEHEHDHDHDHDHDDEEVETGAGVTVHSRGEKKARKLILKLGLKKIEGVNRVVLKRTRNVVFVIENPEVYKNPSSGTYIVFGEAKVDNQSSNLAAQLANMAAAGGNGAPGEAAPASKDSASIQADLEAAVKNTSLEDAEPEVADEDVDTTGLSEEDIRIVMDQANTTKAKAVAGLRGNKGDIVNTIMELTS
jgi:nascent polypeptide-associated complex subunit alpha